jgi:hypothetical protein
MNRNIVLNIIYKEMYKNVNTKYEDMDIFCLNITKMSSCAETLDFKSNFSKNRGGPSEIEFNVYSNRIMSEHMK